MWRKDFSSKNKISKVSKKSSSIEKIFLYKNIIHFLYLVVTQVLMAIWNFG